MIDSHCHLTAESFAEDRAAMIARAWDAGLTGLVTIGAGLGMADNHAAVALAQTDARINATVGLHPHDADLYSDARMQELAALAIQPRVVGIGETGIDYYYQHATRDNQQASFRAHIALAEQLRLPYVVHLRTTSATDLQAIDDCFAIVRECAPTVPGVLHCFSGDWALATRALDAGLMLSVPGIVTFKKTDALRAAVAKIPADHLLLETDAPWLAPVPHRGKRNEPAYVMETLTTVATIRGVSPGTLAEQVLTNTRRVFGIT